MGNVTIYGWEKDIKTISLMRFLVRVAGMTMHEAKQQVDGLLAGEDIKFSTTSQNPPENYAEELEEIGALWRQ